MSEIYRSQFKILESHLTSLLNLDPSDSELPQERLPPALKRERFQLSSFLIFFRKKSAFDLDQLISQTSSQRKIRSKAAQSRRQFKSFFSLKHRKQMKSSPQLLRPSQQELTQQKVDLFQKLLLNFMFDEATVLLKANINLLFFLDFEGDTIVHWIVRNNEPELIDFLFRNDLDLMRAVNSLNEGIMSADFLIREMKEGLEEDTVICLYSKFKEFKAKHCAEIHQDTEKVMEFCRLSHRNKLFWFLRDYINP